MALKLGKCRLCLKLLFGDSFSIFTVDNSLQLAEMVMECSKAKIYEGDGLPDKVCADCIQKLSASYLFKQQCERADEELRRNYVPPPGFSLPPPTPNRQSSDSAFSSQTELSSQTKRPSSVESKVTPANRIRKKSIESTDNASVTSHNHDTFKRAGPKRRMEEIGNASKRARLESENTSTKESDYEDNSYSQFSPESDSDEPLIKEFKCDVCSREFTSGLSLANHKRTHSRTNPKAKTSLTEDMVVDIPKQVMQDSHDDDQKLSCNNCDKTFKLKIMLKRHSETCTGLPSKPVGSPQKELLISLEPIDKVKYGKTSDKLRIRCEMCPTTFKSIDNLEKHMKVCHAAMLKKKEFPTPKEEKFNLSLTAKVSVPCLFCQKSFDDYYVYSAHFNSCPSKIEMAIFSCPVCKKNIYKKGPYFKHIKNMHFEPRCLDEAKGASSSGTEAGSSAKGFECRMCNKKLASQEQLITHLAAHMSNIEETGSFAGEGEESRDGTVDDAISLHSEYSGTPTNASGGLKCKLCDKSFTYKKALQTHELKHAETDLKTEPPDPDAPNQSLPPALNRSRYRDTESDSSQEDGDDLTCDICEKMFSYKRLLIQHKRTKHHMSSGHKRATILLKDCLVKCLICDLDMKVSESNAHNQTHIAVNIKPRNKYTCIACNDTFKSCQGLATHIKLVHRLNKKITKKYNVPDLADFCEVVVTKTEPLDEIQSHNGFGEVPGAEGPSPGQSELTCPVCSKKMPTELSLKRHVNWHRNVGDHVTEKIECFVCKEVFRFKGHFKRHMHGHYIDPNLDPKFLTCNICGRKSKHLRAAKAHMNFHKQTRFKAQDYQCAICKKMFTVRKVYLSHMAIHFKRGESNAIIGDMYNTEIRPSADGTHTCMLCGKVCDSENSLKCHTAYHRSKTLLFGARHECPICKLQFTNKRRMEVHTRTHYEDENGPFKCQTCGKGYNDEDFFRRHVMGHNFDSQDHKKRIEKMRAHKVKCPICTRFYPDLVKLIRHLRRTHPESKMIKEDPDAPPQQVYSCKLCAKVFMTEQRLKNHEETHLRKPKHFKCKFCGKKTISLKAHHLHLKRHLNFKYVDNPLSCPHCDQKGFIKGYELHWHLRDVHGINETWIAERTADTLDGPLKKLQCSICLKVLASKGNYERHLDYHNTLRCNYCFDYFSGLQFLEGHLAFSCEKKKLIGNTEVHPRKIKCEVCYKAFHVQVKLDCHLRTQHGIKVNREASEGKKELVCDYCFRAFENDDALSSHKLYHRTIGYLGCLYCSRKFNTITLYNKHKNAHFAQLHVDDPVKCEHCDEKFVAFREMIYHMRDVHGDDKDWVVMPKKVPEETCNICHKTFHNLPRHLQYHEENRCKKCGEYFFSMMDFDRHLCMIESDEEPENNAQDIRPKYEECRFCFKPMTKCNSILKHDLIHRGSGSISCRFCALKFKTIDAFNIHAFSHRSRKYHKKPLKCRQCGEKFVKYGPFVKHLRNVHKSKDKMHYRAIVKAERCVVCGDDFPNLHNHYRAHLQNRCQQCGKYFTSYKLFTNHECDKEDADPSKVFVSDENLTYLIHTYVPKDENDDEKYYGYTEDEDENVEEINKPAVLDTNVIHDTDSQDTVEDSKEHYMPLSIQSPIISDVLSLYKERSKPTTEDADVNVIDLSDDDVDVTSSCHTEMITIDDD